MSNPSESEIFVKGISASSAKLLGVDLPEIDQFRVFSMLTSQRTQWSWRKCWFTRVQMVTFIADETEERCRELEELATRKLGYQVTVERPSP